MIDGMISRAGLKPDSSVDAEYLDCTRDKARRSYAKGKNLQEIGEYIDALALNTHLQFTVKDMRHLYRMKADVAAACNIL